MTARNIIFSYGRYGDVYISWKEENDSHVLPEIQKLLDAGIVFFVVEHDFTPPITDIEQVKIGRHIVMPDEGLEKLHLAGLISVGKATISGEFSNTGSKAATPEEIASQTTVAVQPPRGG